MITAFGLSGGWGGGRLTSLRTRSCDDKGEEVDKNHAAEASTECVPRMHLVTWSLPPPGVP